MPYNLPKSIGGDSPANDAKMERMVAAIEKTGKSKSSAIAIAKASMEKAHAHPHQRVTANHRRPR